MNETEKVYELLQGYRNVMLVTYVTGESPQPDPETHGATVL